MKKLLLAVLMFMGVVSFAAPTLVVDVIGDGAAVADKGDTSRIVPYKKNFVCFCFLADQPKTVKAIAAAKKVDFNLRPSQGIGAIEVKSFKVNGKELLTEAIIIRDGQFFKESGVESADGTMEMELQISDAEAAK